MTDERIIPQTPLRTRFMQPRKGDACAHVLPDKLLNIDTDAILARALQLLGCMMISSEYLVVSSEMVIG